MKEWACGFAQKSMDDVIGLSWGEMGIELIWEWDDDRKYIHDTKYSYACSKFQAIVKELHDEKLESQQVS